MINRDLDQGLEVAQLQRERVGDHHVGCLRQLVCRERLYHGLARPFLRATEAPAEDAPLHPPAPTG